jgi:hypothetical protein
MAPVHEQLPQSDVAHAQLGVPPQAVGVGEHLYFTE